MSSAAPAAEPTSTDPVEVAARLRLSATRLARRLRQESDTGLSPSQLSALAVIERHGPLTLGALAEHERVAPPSVTRMVARLESRALIHREACADDRRVARVHVTAEGRTLLAEVRRQRTAWLAGRIGALTEADRVALAGALDVLDRLSRGEEP